MAPRRLGPYAKLSATFYRDDAILRAGEAAELLYVRSLAFCAEESCDGYVTDMQITHVLGMGLKAVQGRVRALLEHGLWERVDGGIMVRQWLKWNPSAEEVGMVRRRDRERKAVPRAESSARIPDGIQTESETILSDSLSETGQDRKGKEIPRGRGRPEPSPPADPLAPSDPEDATPSHAGDAVKAYVDGAVESGHPQPAQVLRGRIGKQAKQLLAQGHDPAIVIAAARGCGMGGWNDLAVQMQRDATKPNGARPSTTDARVGAALDLAARLAAQESGTQLAIGAT